jgi:hypothetical protein
MEVSIMLMLLELGMVLQLDPLDTTARLAAATIQALLLPVIGAVSKYFFEDIFVGSCVLYGLFIPGCEGYNGVISSVYGGRGSYLLLAMIAYMVLPLLPSIYLPMGDGDSERGDRLRSTEADLFRSDIDGESSEDIGSESSEDSDEEEEAPVTVNGITREQARQSYRTAGTEVPEPDSCIRPEDYAEVMDPEVIRVYDEVVEAVGLPYQPAAFQRVGAVALGGQRHVVLVMGTGSGKMTVPLLSSLILRKTMAEPRGVTLITQPLTGLMLEQLKNPVCPVAILSMAGELTAEPTEMEGGKLSCTINALLNGEYPVLLGHPESFSSQLGQHILSELQSRDRILQIVLDEFQSF